MPTATAQPTTDQLSARLAHLAYRLTERTGIEWSIGYIGNVTPARDDRTWYAFAAHPGRIGTSADRIGGVATDDLATLATMLSGALALARVQANQ